MQVRIGFASDPMDATQTWTDVSANVQTISIKRGRQHELDRFEAGEATIILRDTDYDFWPDNAGGAYYNNVKIGKAVNINRTHNQTIYHLYTGFIDSIIPSWAGQPGIAPTVTIHCSDFIRNLSKTKLNKDPEYDEELSGTRIGNVLTDASFPGANRDIDTGQESMIASGVLSNVIAQTHILTVAESEIGLFYMAADGDAQWEDRSHRTNAPHDSALSIFGDDAGEMKYVDVTFALDDKFLYNEIRLNRSGGTEQTASDATSQTTYGTRTMSKTGLLLTSDPIVSVYCGFFLARYKDQGNVMRLRNITIKPQNDPDNLWPKVLGYEISSRITVRLNNGSIDDDFFIEGIQHDYNAKSGLWTTKWWLSDATNYTPTPEALDMTLRPVGAGSETAIPSQFPNSTAHWDKVDEETADEDDTYVFNGENSPTEDRDLYAMSDAEYTSGTINSVTVYCRVRYTETPTTAAKAWTSIRTNGTTYDGSLVNPGSSWGDTSTLYTTNPQTSSAWTFTEIDALQAGVRLYPGVTSGFGEGESRCTQVWVIVNYTPTW